MPLARKDFPPLRYGTSASGSSITNRSLGSGTSKVAGQTALPSQSGQSGAMLDFSQRSILSDLVANEMPESTREEISQEDQVSLNTGGVSGSSQLDGNRISGSGSHPCYRGAGNQFFVGLHIVSFLRRSRHWRKVPNWKSVQPPCRWHVEADKSR